MVRWDHTTRVCLGNSILIGSAEFTQSALVFGILDSPVLRLKRSCSVKMRVFHAVGTG